jgi:hypothetical protein
MTCSWACPGPPQSSPELLFVSLSINLQHILGQVWLPRRAALTLVLLFEALVIAILGLVPGQSPTTFAVELLSVGGAVWLFATGMFTVRRPAIDQLAPIVVNAVRRSWQRCR